MAIERLETAQVSISVLCVKFKAHHLICSSGDKERFKGLIAVYGESWCLLLMVMSKLGVSPIENPVDRSNT